MNKRERFCAAVSAFPCLQCPLCATPMDESKGEFCCEKGHSRTLNRKGFLNFLSSPVDTYYDDALFLARQRVFAAGLYQPLVTQLESMIPDGPQTLLDAGCGEGWYLEQLLHRHKGWQGAGIDLSGDAIRRATDHPSPAVWCVGDLRHLPFADHTFSTVLDILSPADYSEFRRVLAPEGRVLKVYPGQHYLQEIRLARGLPLYQEGLVESYLAEKAQVIEKAHVFQVSPVTPEVWADVVRMTPLNQDLTAEEKDALSQQYGHTITLDLHIAAFRFSD